MTAGDDQPYVVESPTRIKLTPEAKYWAEQHGMSVTDAAACATASGARRRGFEL
jgi:hypothetical protein